MRSVSVLRPEVIAPARQQTRWILLRGLAREAGHWGAFPDRLRAAFPGEAVLTPDLPGCGARCRERAPARVDALVEAVRAEREEHRAGPIWLLGLSLGGMVALEWARRFPDEVAGVAVMNSSAGGVSPWWRRMRPPAVVALARAAASRDLTRREARIYRLTSGLPDREAEVVAAWVALATARPVAAVNAGRLLWAGARYRALPGQLPRPALVLVGAGDRLVHPSSSGRLAEALGATLAVHPTAGHELPLDDPAWIVAQLQAWRGRAGGERGETNFSPNRHLVTER